MDQTDIIVVGAGAVGLAIARALSIAGREVIIIEQADGIGTETSSRNSEVIHAGIYYTQGSLKGRLCIEGRRLLYPYCEERGIAHRRTGKVIVATEDSQLARLDDLQAKARGNGLVEPGEVLERISGGRVRELEPQVRAVGGLWSPSTGIVDSHALMLAYLGDAEQAGAFLVANTRVDSVAIAGSTDKDHRFIVRTLSGGESYEIGCRALVNAGGLHAQDIAHRIEGLSPLHVPRRKLVKGNYFSLSGVKPPFTHLVYPIPSALGLGVHATIDLGGRVRFGPDTEEVDSLDYEVDLARGQIFYASIRQYWPGLPDGALTADYAGIRPKLDAPDPDFIVSGPAEHGVPGLVNLFGIESPGLTASMALANLVAIKLVA